jgi:uncharacterized membrane protein
VSLSHSSLPTGLLRFIEWVFVLLGAAICILVVLMFAAQQPDDLWPAPGIYFLEIIFLALAALISKFFENQPEKRDYNIITWIAAGALLAFVILGGFSIGPYLFPAMISFGLAGTAADLSHRRPIFPRLGQVLVAAVVQVAFIGIFLLIF